MSTHQENLEQLICKGCLNGGPIPPKPELKNCQGVPGANIGDGSVPESFIATQYYLSMAEQFNLSVSDCR